MAKKKRRGSGFRGFLALMIVLLVAASGAMIWLCLNFDTDAEMLRPVQQILSIVPDAEIRPTEPVIPPMYTVPHTDETVPPETTLPPEPEHVVSTATILSTGDMLMHGQLINDALQPDGTYDFNYIFPYLTPYVQAADLAVANLETTLGGTAKPYQGNPMFNCPDAIVDAIQNAGFDLLLTANNHSYDTQQAGYERTIQVVREKGLQNLGTMLSGDEPKFLVQDINGIRIGMICYTYEDSTGPANPPALNYNPMRQDGYEILNCFRHADPEPFYQEMETRISEMQQQGAEAIVLYLHWGQEYLLQPNASQTAIAQRLCDLGVDVIIGGHPHVVEPVALLNSNVNPEHRTVCLYSMGNAVSNQRLGKIKNISSAHTEDGVLFSVTFSKYSDGTVYLEDAQLIPTWVRAIDRNGNTVVRDSAIITRYEILPLEESRRPDWQQLFHLDESTANQCSESYQRTMDITGAGMGLVQDYLRAEKVAREANYLWLAQHPA